MGASVFEAVLAGSAVRVIANPDLAHTYSYIDDIGRSLVTLGEDSRALGHVWHLPNPERLSTRRFIQRIACHAGKPLRVQRTPSLVLRGIGLFNPTVRELVEMLFEFEEPFVVDDSKYVRTFGPGATQLDEAIQPTLEWYRERRATPASV
jgi:nucleoside-diphosphate-sugar epimerase